MIGMVTMVTLAFIADTSFSLWMGNMFANASFAYQVKGRRFNLDFILHSDFTVFNIQIVHTSLHTILHEIPQHKTTPFISFLCKWFVNDCWYKGYETAVYLLEGGWLVFGGRGGSPVGGMPVSGGSGGSVGGMPVSGGSGGSVGGMPVSGGGGGGGGLVVP